MRTLEKSSDPLGEEGQITVFTALLFLLMMGISFLIFGGMREYLKSSLVEENMTMAGEDILAQYDRPLFERYHIFLMDPREENDILEEAQDILNHAFDSCGYFSDVNSELSISSKTTALQDKGKPVKKQIKEWESCQGIYQLSEIMNQLLKSTDRKEMIRKELEDCHDEDGGESSEQLENQENDKEKTKEETEKEKEVKKRWKEWKKTLESVLESGILVYAMDDMSKLSKLQIPDRKELPSSELGNGWKLFDLDSISLTEFSHLKDLFEKDTGNSNSELLESNLYMVPYIWDCFSSYGNRVDDKKHCLEYEMEYLIAGKNKDNLNLKNVANQIFLLRFLVNYAYASGDPAITTEAHTMAAILTGILELPQAEKQVAALLIASLCYGESLLEMRALLQGRRVALVKSSSNWNISFISAVPKVVGKADIIEVESGVNYQQYLMALLILKSGSKTLLYRCMDLMQANVALEEAGFRLKNCIYSFQWEGKFSWKPMFGTVPVWRMQWKDPFCMELKKTVTYQ